jgi:signal transduction histidine kinase
MSEPTNFEEAQEKLYQVAEYIHSLNQPLTTIFGQLDLLALKMEDSPHKDQIEKCLEQAERASIILRQIASEYPRRPHE